MAMMQNWLKIAFSDRDKASYFTEIEAVALVSGRFLLSGKE
jgi:hypothetical protein